jgi:hypothetical protein
MRVLSELEESGQEDVVTMINTVMPPTGEKSELVGLQRALKNLVQADYVTMSMDLDSSRKFRSLSGPESLDVIADLESGLRFDNETKLWTDTRHEGPPYRLAFPYILNTVAGKEKGFQILDERGYQWWRPKK